MAKGKHSNLHNARAAKNDEFYTQLSDIDTELYHYKSLFRGKTVLCNCDDPYESNFFKYFASKFIELGLRKLICTSYAASPVACNTACPVIDKDGHFRIICPADDDERWETSEEATEQAYQFARRARFEHGETPEVHRCFPFHTHYN